MVLDRDDREELRKIKIHQYEEQKRLKDLEYRRKVQERNRKINQRKRLSRSRKQYYESVVWGGQAEVKKKRMRKKFNYLVNNFNKGTKSLERYNNRNWKAKKYKRYHRRKSRRY